MDDRSAGVWRSRRGAGLLLAVALAACTAGQPADNPLAAPTATPSPADEADEQSAAETDEGIAVRTVEPWDTADLPVVATSPVALDGAVGYHTHGPDGFELVVVDIATGEVRFRLPSDPGGRIQGTVGGTGHGPEGATVLRWSLRPDGESYGLTLHAHDVSDGGELWTRDYWWATSEAFPCGEHVCVAAEQDADPPDVVERLDQSTGEVLGRGTTDLERTISWTDERKVRLSALPGDGIDDPVRHLRLTDRWGEVLAWSVEGEEVTAALGQQVTPDSGWLGLFDASGVYLHLGAVGGGDVGGMVAFERLTGAVRWALADTQPCYELVREGQPLVACDFEIEQDEDGEGVAWHLTGLRGLDKRTGETAWIHDLGGRQPMSWLADNTVLLGPGRAAIETEEGRQVLDLSTGELSPVDTDEVGVCEPFVDDRAFELTRPWDPEPFRYRPPTAVELCDAAGASLDPQEALARAERPEGFGIEVGETVVWVDRDLRPRGVILTDAEAGDQD